MGIAFLFLSTPALSQESDSTKNLPSLKNLFADTIHSPKKASIMSAIMPGAGQIYNRKYWKLPIIYSGFAGLGYSVIYNNSKFVKYKTEYINRTLNSQNQNNDLPIDSGLVLYSTSQINSLQEYFRRNRDLSVIGIFAFYALNIIDAGVDAHLMSFDVDDKLTFNIQPYMTPSFNGLHASSGVSLRIRF